MTTPPNPDLPYYGATREDVIELGLNPDDVEGGRAASKEYAAQARKSEAAELVVAAREAVESGWQTQAEAAQSLLQAGYPEAHAVFLDLWRAEQAQEAAFDEAQYLPFMDAEEYAAKFAAQQQADLAKSAAEVSSITEKLHAAQVEELRKTFEETIGGHQLAPAAGERLVSKLSASGVLPSTEAEREAVIEETLREESILSNALAEIQEQARVEFRIQHKEARGRDGLMTQGDIDAAEAAYIRGRVPQLADAKKIDTSTFAPTPSAEEESTALAEKYRAKQEKSDSFHRHVHAIGTRAKESRDRGEVLSADRAAFREAMQRAEESVRVGTVRTSLSPDNGAQENENGLLAGFVDEYGPGGYS